MAEKDLDPRLEWVGVMPESWKAMRAKYVFDERRGERGNKINLELLSPTQKYGVVPQSQLDAVVKVKEGTDLSQFKTIHKGDFCISLRSFQGGFEYSNYEGVVSPAYHVLFPTIEIVDGYFKHLFKSTVFISEMASHCNSMRDGQNISYEMFASTMLPIPPLSEQRLIADHLDSVCSQIDSAISTKKQQVEALADYKKSLIDKTVTRGLDGEHETYKDSGIEWIGEIPEEWDTRRLRFLCHFKTGGTPKNTVGVVYDNRSVGCIPWITPGDISDSGYVSYSRYLTAESVKNNSYALYPPESTILVCIGSSLGKCCQSSEWAYSNQQITAVMPNDEQIGARFLFYCIFVQRDLIMGDAAKNAVPIINTSYLKDVRIPLPSLQEQSRIADYLDQKAKLIDDLTDTLNQEIQALEQYKKSTIWEYVTGKKRIA